MNGSSDKRKFKYFQIRWKEKLGDIENPYLIRYTLILFGYSIRLHHWIKSDDCRYFHDHSANFVSIILKGYYWNIKPLVKNIPPLNNKQCFYVEGLFNSWKNLFKWRQSVWYSNAEDQHYLSIPKEGAWTLLLEGRPRHKWGFYVNGHKWRPLRYFSKFGIIQDENYQ